MCTVSRAVWLTKPQLLKYILNKKRCKGTLFSRLLGVRQIYNRNVIPSQPTCDSPLQIRMLEILLLRNRDSAIHGVITHSPAWIALSQFLLKNIIWFPIIDNWNVFYLNTMSSQMKHRRTFNKRKKESKKKSKHLIGLSFTAHGHILIHFFLLHCPYIRNLEIAQTMLT